MIDLAKRVIHKLLLNKLRKKLRKLGKGVYLDERFTVVGARNISLGDSVYIGPNATLIAADAQGAFYVGPWTYNYYRRSSNRHSRQIYGRSLGGGKVAGKRSTGYD